MRKWFIWIAVIAVFLLPLSVTAQNELEASVEADIVSTYVWRGQKLGNASAQPSLILNWRGFSLSAWGSVTLVRLDDVDKNTELDLTASYSFKSLVLGVTDYYIASNGHYFVYDAHHTRHIFELHAGYDFGLVGFDWFINFAGADGLNKDGKRAYSSYVELGVPFQLAGLECKFAAGVVPYATTSYAVVHSFAVTNLILSATKEICLSNRISLPLGVSLVANPSDRRLYLLASVGLK